MPRVLPTGILREALQNGDSIRRCDALGSAKRQSIQGAPMRILALSAAAIMASSAAFAADLPLPPSPVSQPADVAPVPQEQEVSFSGPYAGLQGGGGFNNTEVNLTFVDPAAFFAPCLAAGCAPESTEYDVDGWVLGGQFGFNHQSGMWVFGIEGDINYSDMEGSSTETITAGGFVPTTLSAQSDYGYIGTLRGRLGVALGRVLVYGTGGLAFAEIEDSVALTNTLGQNFVGSEEQTFFGWTGGAGIDVLVTNNIIVGAHALYFDLGEERIALDPVTGFVPPAGSAVYADVEHTGILARGHVSFRFGGGM